MLISLVYFWDLHINIRGLKIDILLCVISRVCWKNSLIHVFFRYICFQSWLKFPFLNGRIECPTNEASWIQRSKEKCKDSNNLYHCLPTQWLNDSIEECHTPKRVQSGLFVFVLFHNITRFFNCYQSIFF